jgi:hypothetical protein
MSKPRTIALSLFFPACIAAAASAWLGAPFVPVQKEFAYAGLFAVGVGVFAWLLPRLFPKRAKAPGGGAAFLARLFLALLVGLSPLVAARLAPVKKSAVLEAVEKKPDEGGYTPADRARMERLMEKTHDGTTP